ncbi:MAG: hypothetical protein B7Y69_08520 [Sphingobacteriia bacterium 35-40-8]|nr:MAG: hypothetical protein B7Y69_08520 [Sphingobacteriia bacterium 35-40-8]
MQTTLALVQILSLVNQSSNHNRNNMKKTLFLFALIAFVSNVHSQEKYFTKAGKLGFDATVPKSPENIDAINKAALCVLDTKTGDIQFSCLMKGFEFERALMMEHFNENYAESDKYPKTVFKGVVTNNTSINSSKDGTYSAKVKGQMTMHGETKEVETEGKIISKSGKIQVLANFNLVFADYKIVIPQLVADKLAKTAKISVDCLLEPLKK